MVAKVVAATVLGNTVAILNRSGDYRVHSILCSDVKREKKQVSGPGLEYPAGKTALEVANDLYVDLINEGAVEPDGEALDYVEFLPCCADASASNGARKPSRKRSNPVGVKCLEFSGEATQQGWEIQASRDGQRDTLVATSKRLNAVMTIAWDSDVYNYAESGVVVGGKKRTIRNVSEARRFLVDVKPPRGPATKRRVRVVADPVNGAEPDDGGLPSDEPRGVQRQKLPFRINDPAERIIKEVLGREIVWVSSINGQEMRARVGNDPNQKQLRVDFHPRTRRRMIEFASVDGGFRAIYLESIAAIYK